MRAAYDAVVIGSGFGGSVAACRRLAQAGFCVGVFERGRRVATN
jgi:cholesterol oxidase